MRPCAGLTISQLNCQGHPVDDYLHILVFCKSFRFVSAGEMANNAAAGDWVTAVVSGRIWNTGHVDNGRADLATAGQWSGGCGWVGAAAKLMR